MRPLRCLRHGIILCALALQIGCGGPGNDGYPSPDYGTAGPEPAPGVEVTSSVLSELSSADIEEIHACFLAGWPEAREWWMQVAGAYLISCVMESVVMSDRDWTPQFERHFLILFYALQDPSPRPLPQIQGESVLEQIKKGVSL